MNTTIEAMPSESLLRQCREAWGLSDLTFIRKMENIVYACMIDGQKCFLRLTSPIRRARPEIEAELYWIEHLARCGLSVPRVIFDKSGSKILSLDDDLQHFEAVVFSAISGEHPSEKVASDPAFLRKLGALIATMHEACRQYEASHKGVRREEWYQERGLRHALAAAATSQHALLRTKLEDALTWIRTLSRNSENYGLVHADLGALNLFVEEESTISIIDFDDSCYHWFAFDLAIVIYSMAGRFGHQQPDPIEQKWLAHLLEGYRSIRSFSEDEEKLIPKFMAFAALRLFFWIEHHEQLGTFHDDVLENIQKLKAWAKDRVGSSPF